MGDLEFINIEGFLGRSIEVFVKTYPDLVKLDKWEFFATLAMIIDIYGSEHQLTSEETFEILERLAEIQKGVHRDLGPFPREEELDEEH